MVLKKDAKEARRHMRTGVRAVCKTEYPARSRTSSPFCPPGINVER